jgi:cysteine desulfurase
VPAEAVRAAITDRTRLVALMLANNEIGTIQPVREVARSCRDAGVPVLCDAVQAAGKIGVSVEELGVDYLTLGAHKLHGPLGAAALWVREGARFEPLLVGGGQERRRRASTTNVPAGVGFGRACELARLELEVRAAALAALRDRFESGLAGIPGAVVHGAVAPRLPHTSSVGFPGLVNVELMMRLDLAGFAVSTGAACGSGIVRPSPALAAMGVPDEIAVSTIRVSFGTGNSRAEVDGFLPVLAEAVAALRAAAPAA